MTGTGKDGDTPLGEYSGVAFQFAISILVFVYAGQWLDRKLDTAPWLLIIGVFFGAGLSFYSMYTKLMAVQARDDAAKAARKDRRL
ncbi:MAG: AtpZ/AtpI family protein [Gemmatimonadota bacterium]